MISPPAASAALPGVGEPDVERGESHVPASNEQS